MCRSFHKISQYYFHTVIQLGCTSVTVSKSNKKEYILGIYSFQRLFKVLCDFASYIHQLVNCFIRQLLATSDILPCVSTPIFP